MKFYWECDKVKYEFSIFLGFSNFKYGDKYASVISEGIQRLPKLTHFNFSDNRLTQKGAKILLSQLGKNVKAVDLTSNSIGLLGCENIYNILVSRDCR